MYDNTELMVLETVYLNEGIHKREISRKLKISMPSVDYALKKLDKILKKQKSGNQIKYFLDYSNPALTPLLSSVEHSRIERLPQKVKYAVMDLLKELENKPIIAVIFGSYAAGNYTKLSDVDILLVFQKIDNSKKIENTARKINLRAGIILSPIYIDYHSFTKSFHDPTKDFFRKLKKDKIVVIGMDWWRQLKDEET